MLSCVLTAYSSISLKPHISARHVSLFYRGELKQRGYSTYFNQAIKLISKTDFKHRWPGFRGHTLIYEQRETEKGWAQQGLDAAKELQMHT